MDEAVELSATKPKIMDLNELESVLDASSAQLNERLNMLPHAYHNKEEHINAVVQRINTYTDNLSDDAGISEREKILLVEVARRHDDGHSGNTYRQDVVGGNRSNEEYAVELMKKDFEGAGLQQSDIDFMEHAILASSFGQRDADALPEGKKHYQRDYEPVTPAEKLFALADVGGFSKGFEGWAEKSMRLVAEQPHNAAGDVDGWIGGQLGFIDNYLTPTLEATKSFFKPEFYDQLQHNLENVREETAKLKDPENPDRDKYAAMLDEAKRSKPAATAE